MTSDHVFEVPFSHHDNYGRADVVEFNDDREDDQDELVTFPRSAWEAMGQPQRVRVIVEPVGDTPESDPSETAIALLPRDRRTGVASGCGSDAAGDRVDAGPERERRPTKEATMMRGRRSDRGTVVHRVSRRERHVCRPPGVWRRWRLDLDAGSVWRCPCGTEWTWQITSVDARWVPTKTATGRGGKVRE